MNLHALPVAPRGDGDNPWLSVVEDLLESHPEPVFAVDRDGDIVLWNDDIASITGVDPETAVGTPAVDVFDRDETLADVVIRRDEAVDEDDVRTATLPGGRLHARASATPLREPGGEVVGAVEILTVVTDIVEQRKRVERVQEQLSDEVSVGVEELRNASEGIARSTQEISELAEGQADDLSEVAEEVATFSATVEEVAASVEQVNGQSEVALERATDSHEAAEHVLDAIDGFAATGATVESNTDDLRENLDEIDRVVEVINDIADQTNLLALNANIEAARAGEAGTGFAVVADEIKDLAEQSQAEVEEIESLVGTIKETSEATQESVGKTTDRIDAARDAAEALAANQEEIETAVRETTDGMNEIASATDDQAASAEEIASMVDGVAERADEVADETTSVAAAHEEQTAMLSDIEDAVRDAESALDT